MSLAQQNTSKAACTRRVRFCNNLRLSVEVITREIPNVHYGDALEMDLNPEEITVR